MRTFKITYEIATTDSSYTLTVVKNFDDEMKAVAYAKDSAAGMPGCRLSDISEVIGQ